MDETDQQRFDIEQVKYDPDGDPVIPRIGFSVPKQFRKEFLQDMIDEIRSTPGELLMAIVVKYYRGKRINATVNAKGGLEGASSGKAPIPTFGPRQLKPNADQKRAQSLDES